MRWLIWAMVLVGVVGIARVLMSATAYNPADDWMRWAASLDLRTLEDGKHATITGSGKAVLVTAIGTDDLARLDQVDPSNLIEPATPKDRLVRVELDGETRRFAIFNSVAPGRWCIVMRLRGPQLDRWVDPCHGARFDLLGRALVGPTNGNLEMPEILIRRGVLYIRPENVAR